MFLLSPHWKHHSGGGGSGGGRNKVADVEHSIKGEASKAVIEEEEEEELQAPMVRIGVLSRSSTVETVKVVVPPSRVPSARVSDSSIETIRQSLREMEVRLVIAQNTVTAETRAEYDLHGETKEHHQRAEESPAEMMVLEKKKVLPYKEDEDKENAQPVPTNQDVKRVLDDLQWAEFVTFRSPKPTHTRSRSQTGKATLCIKSMGRNSHPERQGRSWWRKNPIHDNGEQVN